jgi:heat-inducible transcriptional repressor
VLTAELQIQAKRGGVAVLSERQRLVLQAIIDDYIQTAEPVGSRTISKRPDIGYSPATIRNDMSDLEELGYLEQPHTSAGRIPSQKGYRYYVDHMVTLNEVEPHVVETVKKFLADRIHQTEQIIQQAATIMSTLTSYTAIALGPELFRNTLRHFQLIPLNGETAVAIIVTNTGHVENRTVRIPSEVPMNELERFVNLLNEKLAGVPIVQVRSKLYNELSNELAKHISHYEELIRMLDGVLDAQREEKLYFSGMTNMLNQPEFRNVDKVKDIFDLFDDPYPQLVRMFGDSPQGIQVRIGQENLVEAIHNCSLITATYTIDGQSLGTIGILGPTRMDYAKVISLLNHFSKDLTDLLSRY